MLLQERLGALVDGLCVEAVERIMMKMVELSAERPEETDPRQSDEGSEGLMKTGGETEKWFLVSKEIYFWSSFKNEV